MKNYTTLFFDLDGTLTESGEGIVNAAEYALKKFGIEVEDRGELYKFIGPPLLDTFMEVYGFDEAKARDAIIYYREYYGQKGKYENRPYDGIKELLADLKKSGKNLLVATSKPEYLSVDILEHFGLLEYFSYVSGADKKEKRAGKEDVIRLAMEQVPDVDPSEILMIGDRLFDIIGAKACGLDSMGVSYGYGGHEELVDAGATYVADTVDELRKMLLQSER